jgi:murein DD-endopeptidase MepM/ murein hydrolase activator NlpD
VTSVSPTPLTRRQLRALEANGRFAAPAPLADAAVPAPAAAPVASAAAAPVASVSAAEPAVAAEAAPSAEPTLLAALPLAFEASITHLPVESLVGEEPALAAPVVLEASLAEETVSAAPVADPFRDVLFGVDDEPTAVSPEAIPVIAAPASAGRRLPTLGRRRRASVAARSKTATAPKSAREAAPAARTTAVRDRSKVRSRGVRTASTVLSMGAMLFAGALLVGTSVPANAFMTFSDEALPTESVSALTKAAQAVEVPADSVIEPITREAFTVTSYAEILTARYGTKIMSFAPTTGAIRWPFPSASPVSSGFGSRVAPCRGCSSKHNGVDFTPGMGTPVYAIADGVVGESAFGGSYGQHVYLDHVINGQPVESIYAHMIQGSSPLVAGQTVRVGDFIGLVGSTGASTGAHLHLEIRPDGVPVDPFAWLTVNATN